MIPAFMANVARQIIAPVISDGKAPAAKFVFHCRAVTKEIVQKLSNAIASRDGLALIVIVPIVKSVNRGDVWSLMTASVLKVGAARLAMSAFLYKDVNMVAVVIILIAVSAMKVGRAIFAISHFAMSLQKMVH